MKNYLIIFGIGAFFYGLIEVLWRGNSHWTMMIAGGICFIAFTFISEKLSHIHLLYKCILGSLTVTLVELIFGSVFNIALDMRVWNYSHIPLNFHGQICLLFSVLWGLLSLVAIPFSGLVMRKLKTGHFTAERSYYDELSAQGLGGNRS